MKISYICPIYNEIDVIEQSIDSIVNQLPKGDIVIVDDCSTDGTSEVLKEYASNDNRISLIRNEERRGAAYCKNLATRKANGDIIAVCDADIYKKDRGEKILKFFSDNPEKDVFYSGVYVHHLYKKEKDFKRIPKKVWDGKSKIDFCGITVAYRKKWGIKFPYRELTIDTCCFEAFFLELYKQGAKFGFIEDVTCIWIRHRCNRNKQKANELREKLYLEYGVQLSL